MKSWRLLCLTGLAVAVSGTAFAVDMSQLPHQKAGLWAQTMERDGKPVPYGSSQVCLDAASEAKMLAFSQQMSSQMCQSQTLNHNMDGSWTLDSVCKPGGGANGTVTNHTVMTGDFESKLVTTMSTETSGAPMPQMNGKHEMVMTQTYTGPCKPGQRGGDVTMANGMKMNVIDQQAGAMGAPPPHQ
jgi:hypothetical protein